MGPYFWPSTSLVEQQVDCHTSPSHHIVYMHIVPWCVCAEWDGIAEILPWKKLWVFFFNFKIGTDNMLQYDYAHLVIIITP